MSGLGKNSTGYTKQDYQESKQLALGFKKLKFAHQATAGDAGISFAALNTPPIMMQNGFVQPTLGAIIGANLGVYPNNLYLTSSTRGPLEVNFDYNITSGSRIDFIGFTALQDEVFIGKIDPVNLIGNLVVDGTAQPTTAPLPVGTTDINVGLPFEINKYPNFQVGSIQVFRNGRLQTRNAGNAAYAPGVVGNYQEVPVSGGFGNIVRFNIPGALQPDGSIETIVIVPNGFLVERPQNSMLASIQNIAGQLDSVVPTVAALAGVPQSNFQTNPNDVDLKAFGDLVLSLQSQVSILSQPPVTFSVSGPSLTTQAGGRMTWSAVDFDSVLGWNSGTNRYLVAQSGLYLLDATLVLNDGFTYNGSRINMSINVNGAGIWSNYVTSAPGQNDGVGIMGMRWWMLNQGDLLDVSYSGTGSTDTIMHWAFGTFQATLIKH